MRRKSWFLLLPALVSIAYAQESDLDSLTRELGNHPQQDTVRVDLLNELAFAYYSSDPDKGLEYSREALALATILNNLSGLAKGFNNKSTNHWAKGEDSLALVAGERALEIHREAGNKLGAAKALNNLALNYYSLSDLRKALEYHYAALSLFRELDHSTGIAHSYSNAGVVYLSLSDYPKALEYFLNAARFAKDNDEVLRANISLNIGLVYKNMKEYKKARQYANDALAIYSRLDQRQGQANALGNLGTLYSEQGYSREALDHYTHSLELNTSIGNKRRIAGDLVNIAAVYQHMGDYASALDYLKRGLDLYEHTSDKENTCFALVKLAEVDLERSLAAGRKHVDGSSRQRTLDYLQRARLLSEESGSLQRQQMVWEVMSRVLEEYGSHAKALDAYKTFVALRDSIFNSEKDMAIARQQIQFDYEKKEALLTAAHEKEMVLAQAELERQKAIDSALLTGALLIVLASTAGYILNKKKKNAERRRREAEFKTLIAETRMKALRAQMNPHFIFNSLNAISNFMANHQLDAAEEYLMCFSRVIRMTLESSDHTGIPLSDDLKVLELYLRLEKTRLKDRFTYEIQVSEAIDCDETFVPPLILQPIVENSIWHGVSKLESGGRITVTIDRTAENLICHVDDNGPGRRNGRVNENSLGRGRKSLGLHLTRSRLEILNEENPASGNMLFTDLATGLRVTVTLPLLHRFEHEYD